MSSEESDWVFVPNESENKSEKVCSDLIEKFYWRETDSESELLVIFREKNRPRYKYIDVPVAEFQEMRDRVSNPEEYQKPLGKWFLRNITEEYDFVRFSDQI